MKMKVYVVELVSSFAAVRQVRVSSYIPSSWWHISVEDSLGCVLPAASRADASQLSIETLCCGCFLVLVTHLDIWIVLLAEERLLE